MLTHLLSHTVLFKSVLGVNSIVDSIVDITIVIIKLTEVIMMMMMMMKDSRLNREFQSCRNQSSFTAWCS